MEFTISNLEDWKDVIKEILPKLHHSTLLLKGNLGVGKTTFTQFLLQALGSTDEVSSPTYTIVNEYDTPKGKVYHFDLYRLKNKDEVFDIGIEDYLDHAFLCIIEWPEVFEEELDDQAHLMSIEKSGEQRKVTFK